MKPKKATLVAFATALAGLTTENAITRASWQGRKIIRRGALLRDLRELEKIGDRTPTVESTWKATSEDMLATNWIILPDR